jgi:Uma2 family endonuclease
MIESRENPQSEKTMSVSSPNTRNFLAPKFENGQQWHESLGCVPMGRVLFTPWPGSATEQDLIELADRDERYCEWIYGTLVEKPSGDFKRRIVMRIINQLSTRIVGHGMIRYAAAAMRTISGCIRAPDIAYISFNRLPQGTRPKDRIPTISPQLVVEVMTETNTENEIQLKLADYFASGTELAWIIHPDTRTVDIHVKPTAPDHFVADADVIQGAGPLPKYFRPIPVNKFFETVDSQAR